MRHDRDAVRGESANGLDHLGAAFDLDRVHARLFQKTRRIAEGVGRAGLVGAERHVADEERPRRAARDRRGVPNHVVHRHRHGRGITEHHHAERVADQDHVYAGLLDETRERGVVCRHHRDALAVALHRDEVGDGDFLRGRRGSAAVLIAHFEPPSRPAACRSRRQRNRSARLYVAGFIPDSDRRH